MKLQKKQLSAATALALMLTIVATLVTSVPNTFGQVGQLLSTTAATFIVLNPIGLGQTQMARTTIYPVAYSINHTYTITRPNGTTFTLVNASDPANEESFITFVVDQLGTWKVTASWAGDATHRAPTLSSYTAKPDFVCQSANVTDPPTKVKTVALVSTVPKDKIGTGQAIYIVSWIHPPREYITALFPEFDYVITKPDGTKDTFTGHPDSPATDSFSYVCSQAGKYSIVMKFPGNYLYEASESPAWTWTVEDGYVVPTYPDQPLPTGPWKFPISIEYQQWYQISGPWPESSFNMSCSNFNPYSTAPNTPHVLWRMQGDRSGITGGSPEQGGGGIVGYSGSAPTCVAAQGRLYCTTSEPVYSSATTLQPSHPVLWCIDQFTGQVIYKKDIPGTGTGGTPIIEIQPRIKVDPEAAEFATGGAFSLWLTGGGVWEINPWNGAVMYYNATLVGSSSFYSQDAFYFANYPMGGNFTKFDCRSKAISWTNNAGTYGIYGNSSGWIGSFPVNIWNGILVSRQEGMGSYPYGIWVRSWNATDGTMICSGSDTGLYSSETGSYPIGDGKIFLHCSDRCVHAIDIYTGKEVWKSEAMDYPWGAYAAYSEATCYDKVIYQSWDGHLYAFDLKTGKTDWKGYYTGNTTETAMGTYAWWGKLAIADHKIYGGTGQHTPPSPYPRGDRLYCLNADTGAYIWSLPWQTGSGGISSGMLFQTNTYDGCLYMFGKGQTATTVSAPMTAVPLGTGVLIEGTVTDQSPGAPGTPAVSDASQEQWVQYLYMNKPMPTNATGVSVHLQAMLSDGTVIDITHVTTDIMGHYEYTWTPPAEGTYKILATFEGSESYWTSSEQTGLSVGPAAPSPSAPAAAPDNTPIFYAIIAAAVAIIIVVAIATILILRKRQ